MEAIIVLFVGLLFGFWGMSVCESKNRTTWKGFVSGFMLGIIGIAICYSLDKK